LLPLARRALPGVVAQARVAALQPFHRTPAAKIGDTVGTIRAAFAAKPQQRNGPARTVSLVAKQRCQVVGPLTRAAEVSRIVTDGAVGSTRHVSRGTRRCWTGSRLRRVGTTTRRERPLASPTEHARLTVGSGIVAAGTGIALIASGIEPGVAELGRDDALSASSSIGCLRAAGPGNGFSTPRRLPSLRERIRLGSPASDRSQQQAHHRGD
jgi:hypothetical protein